MSWHTQIARGNTEHVGGVRAKKTVPANPMGLKRSTLGDISNKVVSRSNTTVATKPASLVGAKELVKPLQRASSVISRSNSTVATKPLSLVGAKELVKPLQRSSFAKPLPRVNVTSRVKRTVSNASVASVVLPSLQTECSTKGSEAVTNKPDEVENVDEADEGNPLLVANYAFEIYQYLLTLEDKYPIREKFLEGREVTPKMRSVLIDWLVEVQMQYHLLQETLYLAIQILDRYLQAVPNVTKKYLQLVGVAAMYVACKYEEVYMPALSDFVFITDNAYSRQQLLEMECQVLKVLDFEISRPISLTFLRRYSKIVAANPIHHCFSKYFLELALMEYSLAHVKPSLIAASALFISLCIHELNNKRGTELWDAKMVHYSSYTQLEVIRAAHKLAPVVLAAQNPKFEAVKKKYASSKMMKVSLRSELESECLKRLALGQSPYLS